jgi:ribose transport system substrate-binding protein
MMKPFRNVCMLALTVLVGGCGGQGGETASPETAGSGTERTQIAVIPKGTTHDFWKSIHAGAAKAAQELDLDIIWMGAEKEDDRKQQIDVVQSFIARGVDAIVLAPLDDTALVRPVETAVGRGIPVVIIDSGLNTEQYASFVATDNREGGRLGARRLGTLMGGKGNALLLRYSEGSASTMEREEGFLEVMRAEFPDIVFVSDNQYAGATKESALQASQNLLNRFGDQIQGIFCPNESSTFGMLRALQTSGRAGVHFVGFDTSEALVTGLREGQVHGLVSQDPFDMGYQGVKTAAAVIRGEDVPKRIPTRLELITPENVDDPDIAPLIKPDLDQWLK